MITLDQLPAVVRQMVGDAKSADKAQADAHAEEARALLGAHNLETPEVIAARTKLRSAESDLAKATAVLQAAERKHFDAKITLFRLDDGLSREWVRLRKASVAPWRIAAARDRLLETIDKFRHVGNAPIGDALKPLTDCQHHLNALMDGATEPPADGNPMEWVDAAIAEHERMADTLRKEHSARVAANEKAARAARILT